MYGPMEVSLEGGKLVLRRHRAWVGDLEHWHHDTFLVRWRDRVMGKNLVTFRLSPQGSIDALEMEGMGELLRVVREGR